MKKNQKNQLLHPEYPWRVAHESHKFERVFPNEEKIWSGYSRCKCGAQRFYGIIGQSCQDSAVEPCQLSSSEVKLENKFTVLL